MRRAHLIPVIALGLLTLSSQAAQAQAAKAATSNTVKISEEKPGLLAKAAVKADSATAIALAAVPGGRVVSAEIENEDGALIYSFDIRVTGKSGIDEVHVDARTGKVLKKEHETPADEKAEAAKERAAAKKTTTKKPPM